MVKVKNVEGSSFLNPPFPYSSWLDYWEKIQVIEQHIVHVLAV